MNPEQDQKIQTLEQKNRQLEQKNLALEQKSVSLETRIRFLETLIISPRVQIKNLEGALKIGSTAPTTNDTQEGCLFLTNESGTYKFYARINNGWRGVTLT